MKENRIPVWHDDGRGGSVTGCPNLREVFVRGEDIKQAVLEVLRERDARVGVKRILDTLRSHGLIEGTVDDDKPMKYPDHTPEESPGGFESAKDVRELVLDVLAEERNSERGRDVTLRGLAYEQQRVDEDLFKVLWEDFGMAPDEDLAPGGIELKRRLRAIVGADDTPQESDTVPAELVQELVKALALMGNPPKSTQDSLFAAHGFLRALAKVKECLG